ncbi:hypothetical protein PY254_12365 [Rhodanobacter sp. AS-Z3]|nr:hypothetical protein [Rhodanobacter sp. AS-Z3]WEN14028.1 hypothetical protein PY254_12365 [Rhodanobacter sp. AS-Z3]
MDKPFARDGVHPTQAGYAIMAPLAQHANDEILAGSLRNRRGGR